MGRDNSPPIERGMTGYQGAAIDSNNLKFEDALGMVKEFEDVTWSDYGAKGVNSAARVQCMLVRNLTGGAVTPGQAVELDFTTPAPFTIKQTAQTVNGPFVIVDEYLPSAGCPNYDVCWVVIQGPCKPVITPGNSSNASAGAYLGADATAKGTLVPEVVADDKAISATAAARNNGFLLEVCAKTASTRQSRYYMRSRWLAG
jgi:hypothetical protein